MKNRIGSTLALASLLVVLAISNAQAQVPSRVVASVPFDFTAGKATLKSGQYRIQRLNGSALSIKSATKTFLVNAPLLIGTTEAKGGERLVFNRYGGVYFLTQVWLSADSGRQLFPSELEKKTAKEFQLAHNGAKPERVEVAIDANE